MKPQYLETVRKKLSDSRIDGWLVYDFRGNNPFLSRFCEEKPFLTRRFFYWIPKHGEPIALLSAIEADAASFPGEKRTYRTGKELVDQLRRFLKHGMKVAMEASPNPYLSKVDSGTVDLIRSIGIEVVGSGDLLTQTWDQNKIDSHLVAADFLDKTVAKAWDFIKEGTKESEVSQFILDEFKANDFISNELPICAVNANSANPHYQPKNGKTIKPGDFILIDLWCKQNRPDATYADITRVGVFAPEPTERQQEIFSIVKEARDTATTLVKKSFAKSIPLTGAEVDRAARAVIAERGYGDYFIHRLGHNIDTEDHGDGPHLDSYETDDTRLLLPGTCFSIEPGIYLPGEFGVRLEYDILVYPNGKVEVTGGIQNEIMTKRLSSL